MKTITLDTPPPAVQRWTRVAWVGEIDGYSVEPLAWTVRDVCDHEVSLLEVDLSGVTFMDCAGLSPLVVAHARLLDRIRLFAPSPPVTRLLDALDLDRLFVVVGPLGAAPGPHAGPAEPSGPTADVDRGANDLVRAIPRSLTDRATIEQAKGLLMGVHGCDAAAAWHLLRSTARTQGVRIRVMAKMLVDDATSGPYADPGHPERIPGPADDADDVRAEFARSGPASDGPAWPSASLAPDWPDGSDGAR